MSFSRKARSASTMLAAAAMLVVAPALWSASGIAAGEEHSFEDPLFRRCIEWMLSGTGGALIDNRCRDDFGLPPPSIFICARKVRVGFDSTIERDGCALIFEEQAEKSRAGYVK